MKAATDRRRIEEGICQISIHAAREGGDWTLSDTLYKQRISIHAAREGGDCHGWEAAKNILEFQSTPPVKAATLIRESVILANAISIHAAREGGD